MEAVAVPGAILGLILCCVGAAGECTISVSQPPLLEVDPTQGVVTVPCSFSTVGCSSQQPSSLWLRYGAHQAEVLCMNGCTSKADKFTEKTLAQNQVSLTVNQLTPNDSAIYVCGIVSPNSPEPGAKQTGDGTVLVVRGTKGATLQSLLIALLSLLSVYVAGVLVTLLVLSRSKFNTPRNKETGDSQKKKSARRIFQEIAQELYSKRYVGTSQSSASEKDNTYENRTGLHTHDSP